ncbi:MAG: hypothetical protein A2X94_16870 [Bdellovibrionales bacterium GWB1_55_8]|nr:MAG: hypothetical protein A2X94_16870 [Bdellovibrionales bacterium GWB1_55_8]
MSESIQSSKPTLWRLRAGADRRFRMGHPWVYSNELTDSPKGIEPGAPVELRDAAGNFLARGYGNPHSLISFRALTRNSEIQDPGSVEALKTTLVRAKVVRRMVGLGDVSHRWIFGEADGLPGLILDRFRVGASRQVVSIQAHTAGADRLIPRIMDALQLIAQESDDISWDNTSVILRNDLGVRKLEGVPETAPQLLKSIPGMDYSNLDIKVASAAPAQGSGKLHLELRADLLKGQKTGFFLDQFANIQLAALRSQNMKAVGSKIRILDLCCYVGQWSAQLARLFLEAGHPVEIVAVDASARALELAKVNIERQRSSTNLPPLKCEFLRLDVLKELGSIGNSGDTPADFDLVISDPPALIQGRKDIPAGTHAYLQLNTQVFRLVREGGLVVSCSCSGLLEEEDFVRTIGKAAYRNRRQVRWVARGSQSPDHPMLAEFPEGRYLKCWIGVPFASVSSRPS